MTSAQLPVCRLLFALSMLMQECALRADENANGPNGISSSGLPQTGLGVTIGVMEGVRVLKPFLDDDADTSLSIEPTQVYVDGAVVTTGLPELLPSDPRYDDYEHAMYVASILISTDPLVPGVAPDAMLHSGGVTAGGGTFESQLQGLSYAIDGMLRATGGEMSAINHSYGFNEPTGYSRDGTSTLSLYMDWSSRKYDVLHVFAVDELGASGGTGAIPEDSYNGINVAGSRTEVSAYYRAYETENRPVDLGVRSNVDILAPGDSIDVLGLGGVPNNRGGTSYAAPFVTGTVALLQQRAIEDNVLGFADDDAYRHEVMKAVILNSADKLEDTGNGYRLGMTRDVVRSNGISTWLDSPAYTDATIALDPQLGAGHLNAERAMKQFARGEHDVTNVFGSEVPNIGWDYANTNDNGAYWNEYELADPLPGGSFISITVTWDRKVNFVTDGGTSDAYDIGDTFEAAGSLGEGFNDVDIYLMPKDAIDLSEAVWASTTPYDNTEHLFWQIPENMGGEYEFWVYEWDATIDFEGTNYAVAWWAYDGPVEYQGDFDGNGVIDGGDYTLWASSYGSTVTPGAGADGNGDGIVDAADYTIWRDNYVPASTSAPEPGMTAATLIAVILSTATCLGKRRCSDPR